MRSTRLISSLVAAGVVVIVLGIAREFFVSSFGLDTILEDLRQISLDTEHSLGSWWSSLLMAGCAGLMIVLARSQQYSDGYIASRWLVLAGIFMLMSLDESVSFHELLIDPLRNALDLSGILFFSWIVPAFFVCAGLALFFVPFLRRLPAIYAVSIVAAGALYVTGALGLEAVGGYFADKYGMQSTSYIVTATIEETIEIIGLTWFAAVLIAMLRAERRGFNLRIA